MGHTLVAIQQSAGESLDSVIQSTLCLEVIPVSKTY